MITGIRLLPWLVPTDDNYGHPPFNCETCQNPGSPIGYQPEEIRRSWHCGYMERAEWTKYEGPKEFGDIEQRPIELDPEGPCLGWIVRQPAIIDAAQTHIAFKNGALGIFYPDPPKTVLDAAQHMTAAWNGYEAYRMRKSRGT